MTLDAGNDYGMSHVRRQDLPQRESQASSKAAFLDLNLISAYHAAGDTTPPLSPLLTIPAGTMPGDQQLRLPKNKSTGNLLSPKTELGQRARFSFDAGSTQEITNLKR